MHEFRLHPGKACQPHCHTGTDCNHAIKLAVENAYGPQQPPAAFNLCCICPKALWEIFRKSCKTAHLEVRKEIAGPTDLQKLECRAQPQQRGQYASTFQRQPCAPSHSACQRQSLVPFQRQHLAPSKTPWSWLSFSCSFLPTLGACHERCGSRVKHAESTCRPCGAACAAVGRCLRGQWCVHIYLGHLQASLAVIPV